MYAAFLCGRSLSLASRYYKPGRALNPSTLQFTTNRWNFFSAQTPVTQKLMAHPTSDIGQQPALSDRLLGIKGKHILWMDLTEFKYGQGEVIHYSSEVNSTNCDRLEEVPKMMKQLKRFVEADARKCPSERIDSVQWKVYEGDEPTAEMWQILDGLSPRHLNLVAGRIEECHITPLNTLQHQWNDLDTLTLNCVAGLDFTEDSPNIFSRISSLTLNFCCGSNVIPPAATRLKHLRILENNVCDMFNYAVDNQPLLAQALKVVELDSTNGCDFWYMYEPQDFRDRIQKCVNLQEFRFAACYDFGLDTDLASYIPPSVEKLTLRFTRSLPFLHDIEDWIQHASDRTWLPHLKSFQLAIDPESRVRGIEGESKSREWTRKLVNPPRELTPEAFDMEFKEKRNTLYDVLRSTRPFIDLRI